MVLSHDPHGNRVAGSHSHQIPTPGLCRAHLVPECQVAVDLPDGTRCRSEPRAGREGPFAQILGTDGPIDDEVRTLLGNGVKTGGLVIRDPTIAATSLYSISVEATDMLASTLIRNKPINVEAHQNCLCAAGMADRKNPEQW
ncbi:hypothetical protein ACHAW6_002065 [Cyclotella cf. meneghiniana]